MTVLSPFWLRDSESFSKGQTHLAPFVLSQLKTKIDITYLERHLDSRLMPLTYHFYFGPLFLKRKWFIFPIAIQPNCILADWNSLVKHLNEKQMMLISMSIQILWSHL